MSVTPPDHVQLGDMLEWARKVQRFVADTSEDGFLLDERTQSAVIHGLIVIGEIATRVGDETRAASPDVPWHEIRGMRNRLVRDYLGVDIDEVWRIAAVRSLGPAQFRRRTSEAAWTATVGSQRAHDVEYFCSAS